MTGEPAGDRRTTDLAHEALIRGWPTLRGWVNERRQAEQARRRLEDKAAEWLRLEEVGGFLDEAELAEAERWLGSADATELGTSKDLDRLVTASRERIREARDRDLTEARTRAAEQADAARKLRRRLWLARGAAATAAVAAIVAIVFFTQARDDRDQAQREAAARATAEAVAQANANASLTQALAAQASLLDASGDDETAALLAAQAWLFDADTHAVAGPVGSALQASIGSPYFSTHSPVHPSSITTLVASPDGAVLAVARDNGGLELWAEPGITPCTVDTGGGSLLTTSVAFSPDGQRLVSGSRDGRVREWDIREGACRPVRELEGPGGPILGVATGQGAGGPIIVAASCATGEAAPEPFAAAPACPEQGATIVSWSEADPTPRTLHDVPGASLCALAASPDGRWLAAGTCGTGVATGCPDGAGTVLVWEMAAGGSPQCLAGHTRPVLALAFDRCTGRIASGSADRRIGLWDRDAAGAYGPVAFLTGQNEAVRAVTFSGDCTRLAAGSEDGTVRLWPLERVATEDPIMVFLGSGTQWVRAVAFTGEQGDILVSEASLGRARRWNLGYPGTGQPAILPGHSGYLRAMAFSPVPGSLMLASVAEDGTVRLWDLETGTALGTIEVDTGPPPVKLASVAIGEDGTLLAAGDERNGYHVWDISDPAAPVPLFSGTLACEAEGQPLARDAMVAFAPGSDLLVVAGCAGRMHLWSPGDEVVDRPPDPALGSTVMALAFSPDGGLLATGHRDGTVALWQRSDTGLSLLHRVPRGHAGRVWAIAVHPDGSQVATGGEDRLIRLWPVSGTGLGEPRTLEGHANEVRAVAFSPDGALLFSGSRDQSVRIHQVTRPDQQPVVIPDLMEWVRTIAISADGTVLAAASDSASIRLIVPGSDDLARLACEAIRREPLSDTEWQRFVGTHEPRRDTCAVITGLPDGAPPVVRDSTRTTITRRRDRPPTSPLHHPTRRHFARGACRDRHPISL